MREIVSLMQSTISLEESALPSASKVHHIEVEGDVLIGKAFGLKALWSGLCGIRLLSTERNIILAGCVLMEGHKGRRSNSQFFAAHYRSCGHS